MEKALRRLRSAHPLASGSDQRTGCDEFLLSSVDDKRQAFQGARVKKSQLAGLGEDDLIDRERPLDADNGEPHLTRDPLPVSQVKPDLFSPRRHQSAPGFSPGAKCIRCPYLPGRAVSRQTWIGRCDFPPGILLETVPRGNDKPKVSRAKDRCVRYVNEQPA